MSRPHTAPDYRTSTPANDPRYDGRWKMPGYTGHINAVYETFGTTPVPSQRKAHFRNSSEMDPIYKNFAPEPRRDPCNNPATWIKPTPELLWPTVAGQHGRKNNINNKSSIVFGDRRIEQTKTHYADTLLAPTKQASIWEPEITQRKHRYNLSAMNLAQRHTLYASMRQKLGEVHLGHILENLKLRFSAKLNTASNSNGFRLLKLFQNYDENNSGTLELEEFVAALASFGIQLPEEAEVVLFSNFDSDENGLLDYTEFVSQLVEPEYLSLGFSAVHKSGGDPNRDVESMIRARFMQLLTTGTSKMLKDEFKKMDSNRDGHITRAEFNKALTAKNIHITPFELDYIFARHDVSKDGRLHYNEFAKIFFDDDLSSTLGQSKMTSQWTQRFFTQKM
mmetsp:Transcript_7074/g.8145  ORF Transcript_7074/g.8145 Transcript_7074/m.8145 type:complete len:393 (-) Transcript_7074:406-1584(-)|eukprot:CAMPEP_0197848086 /NCGR_PEP_ID=MMETSP1438-20131217/7917_1 /TAXON_ID=1461541 /ORGANISM="Pterosperma sp., Strain CCMP1384" /LENGTH=392 /DNA_ID=CAMNT_0043460217 /DNA_START=94 /DNA_END=1275 /DNA_ORIENTATION=+